MSTKIERFRGSKNKQKEILKNFDEEGFGDRDGKENRKNDENF